MPRQWPGRLASLFTARELDALESAVGQARQLPVPRARLAHGNPDVTHLARMTSAGTPTSSTSGDRSVPLFEDFLTGYGQGAALLRDHRDLIRLSAITSGLRQLSLWLGPGRDGSPASDRARRRATTLRNLLAGRAPAASE